MIPSEEKALGGQGMDTDPRSAGGVPPSLVAHVTARYPPYLGGLEKVVESLAAQQRRDRLAVRVLTSRQGMRRGEDRHEDYVKRLGSVEVANTVIMPGLPGAILKLPRDCVLHVHVAHAYVPEVVCVASRVRRIPYVAHLHLDVGPSSWAGFLLRVYKPLVLGPVLRRAAAVIVFTEEQRALTASAYRVDPARIVVVPNGVGEEFFHAGERELRTRPRLLFVGRLSVQKNVALLLQALAGISDRFETTIVGDGSLAQELKTMASDLRLANVDFHGRASGRELLKLYENADVFVLPSEREGFPLVLLEALAMGLPIVASDVPGNRDLVGTGRNGFLFPSGDAAALRRALLKATEDRAVYRRMSRASRQLAEQYSWREVSGRFAAMYSHLGSAPAAPRA